jgi:hypothetical protein
MLGAEAPQEIEGIKAEAEAEPSPLKGEWPSPAPRVSLDLRGATVGEALQQLADAAGWGLAMGGADAHAETGSLTIAVENKPATELLEIILETNGLEAKLKAGVLMVSPTGPPPGAVEAEIGDLHVKVKPGHGIRIHGSHGEKDNRVVTGNVRVEKDEVVNDAVAMGGSVEVAGHVRGDAVAMGGSVTLEPGARVDGDAVAMGGEVIVPDDAVVHGDRVAMGGGSIGSLIGSLAGAASGADRVPLFAFGILAALVRAVTLIILALLIMTFLPERVERVRDFMVANTGQSVLGGLALLLGLVPLIVLLAITVVGIALIPVVVVVFASFLVVGLTALATWLGRKIPLFEERKTPMVAMLLGLAIILLVDFIPFVGTPIIFAASLVAAGAVMLSRFGRSQPDQPAEPPASTEEPAL